MWKRTRRSSLGQDLYDTADELRVMERQLMQLSADLANTDNHHQAELATRMVLTLQERESQLRKHADRLTSGVNQGRRASDSVDDRGSSDRPGA